MRLLLAHADRLHYKCTEKAVKFAEEDLPREKEFQNVLVVFTAVEEGDGPEAVSRAVEEIKKVWEQVGKPSVVIYPWVHLTSAPAKPQAALALLKELAQRLGAARVPFGWYKAFTLSTKGHPLSELSRHIKTAEEEHISAALKKEEKMHSEFYILTEDGQLTPADQFDYSQHPYLRVFYEYEVKKVRAYETEPPHIRLMKEQGIAGYEEGSDAGNLRFYPKGVIIKRALEAYVGNICKRLGAMEVETPVMYDFNHPALARYLNRFPARQYVVKSDKKEYFLRFAACFGQFLMMKDLHISHHQLPLHMYELTRYSFRRELSGELVGLKRLRAFTMPDMHTLVKDMEQAKEEFFKQLEASIEWLKSIEVYHACEIAFRVEKEFFEKNREWYVQMVRAIGKPALIEIFPERYAYFITKFEFNYIDNARKATALSTVQIDVENAQNYGITYVDSDNQRKTPMILHASISGAIERSIYAVLEEQARRMAQGKKAEYPFWLAPVQVRLIPLSAEHTEKAARLAAQIIARVDIDDREETVSKRIREAEKEWIPFIVVVGDQESEARLNVRDRNGKTTEMSLEAFNNLLKEKQAGKPFIPLLMPERVSKRPIF